MIAKFLSQIVYPVLLTITLVVAHFAISMNWNLKTTYGVYTVGLVLMLIGLEWMLPLQKRWSMTGSSLLRDLKYIGLAAPVIAGVRYLSGILGIYLAENHSGLLRGMPIILSALIALLVWEFFQYWFHRFSHSARGPIGRFLWSAHLAHHLPDRVYVTMHAVFHPVNAIISATILQLSFLGMGIGPEAALIAMLLIDLQSLVSHFNFDLRAGWMNYIFIGAETHRYHHSATDAPANFGNTLAIWDIVFGTFVYKPGATPDNLGLVSEHLPDSNDILSVLRLPFAQK